MYEVAVTVYYHAGRKPAMNAYFLSVLFLLFILDLNFISFVRWLIRFTTLFAFTELLAQASCFNEVLNRIDFRVATE